MPLITSRQLKELGGRKLSGTEKVLNKRKKLLDQNKRRMQRATKSHQNGRLRNA